MFSFYYTHIAPLGRKAYMGMIRDIVSAADNSVAVSSDVKETLSILMSLAKAKVEAFEGNIKEDLSTGKTTDNLTIAITKVIATKTELRATTQTGTSKIIDTVKDSLGEIFSGDGKILDGVAGILSTALTAIMGAGAGQESETRIYKVFAEYPAIVRYDFAFWGRNIETQSIKNYMENVLPVSPINRQLMSQNSPSMIFSRSTVMTRAN